jgi:class 3 adenylate cyclase
MGSGAATEYAQTSDGAYIAYQVTGDGPTDLLVVFGPGLSVEDQVAGPFIGGFVERLASFARVIRLDRRGYGLSDPIPVVDSTSWEKWVDDMVTVLDATDTARTAVFASESSTGIVSMLLAAAHPERVSHLVLFNPVPRWMRAHDYPWGFTEAEAERFVDDFMAAWLAGRRPPLHAPSLEDEDEFWSWWISARRRGMSPSVARAVYQNGLRSDVRSVLPAIGVPTLVLHRASAPPFHDSYAHARFVTERIRSARLVEVPGEDSIVYVGDTEAIAEEVEEFITGTRSASALDRVLATVLFTDIEASTARAAAIGDRAWRKLLDRFRAVVREQLSRHRGREINTRGDDFLATFDGPARAIRCAQAIGEAAAGLGVSVCSGLHAGEVELMGNDIGGIAVHIGARVAELARPGEVLVSRTVVDLVAGSGLTFDDRGEHELRGVPGSWRLFAVAD